MKIIKKIVSLLLVFCLILSDVSLTFASQEGKHTGNLEVGKTYAVPVTRLDRFGLPIDWTDESEETKEYGQNLVNHEVLVTPQADGKYEVTFQHEVYRYYDAIQFCRQDKFADIDAVKANAMGTYNIPERFNLDFKQVPYREKYDFTELMHTLFLDAENDKYYQDAKIVNDEAKEISYITMKIDSVEKNLYFKALESWKYGSYTPTKYLRDPLKKPEEVLIRCRECITNGGYSFDIAKAREVKPLSVFATGNVEFDVERPTKTLDPFAGPIPTPAADQIITDMINANPEVVQNTDGTIDVTFTLKDASKFKNIGVAKDRTPVTPNDQDVYMRYMTRGYFGMNYTDVTLDGNKFTVKYANANEAAWGKNIKFAVDLGEINPSDNNPVDTIFLFDLKLSAKADAKPEPKPEKVKFENNGWSFEVDKKDVADKTAFEAKSVTEGKDFDTVSQSLKKTHSSYFVYAPVFSVSGKAEALKKDTKINVNVPGSWEAGNMNFYSLEGDKLTEIKEFKVKGGQLEFNTKDLNKTFVIAHKLIEGSIKGLADGVYTTNVKLWQTGKPSDLSMADGAIKPNSAVLEVKDGQYTLYLGLQGIKVGEIFGYTYQLRYKDNENHKQVAEPLGWITVNDSVYNIDRYAQKNNIIYPSTVKIPIAANNIARNKYEVIFNVAVMDELMGVVPGSGTDSASRSALLKFYDVQKVETAAPTYEASYLLKAVEDGEAKLKEDLSKFETATVENLKNKVEAGRTLYGEMLQKADGNQIKNAYDAIYEAIKGLKEDVDGPKAEAVDQLIDAIGEVTLESEKAINDARTAYDALTDKQKNLVTKLDVLEAAESRLAVLKQEAADKAAAQIVIDQITAIGDVTLEKEADIVAARNAYNVLTEDQKAYVTNESVLADAEAMLETLKAEAADKAVAAEVDEKIAAIGEVSLVSESAIVAAREAYDALTEDQKAFVENLAVLEAAEARLAELKEQAATDQELAQSVTDKIEALPTEVTLEDAAVIEAARSAYDALTEDQKALVGNVDKLVQAEADLEVLKEQEAADKAAAAEVDALIDAIGTVTVDSKEAIEAARSAYDALTEEQKAFVEKLGVLEAAEATLEELLKPVVTGWTQNGNIWGYVKEDGTAAANEFVTVGANTFYFDNNGAMVTGWKEVDGNWYYFYTSGRMLYGWQKIGANWFYLGTDGIMATGWQKIGNNWFYFYSSGRMLTGWQKIGANWFYFYSSGRMVTGTQVIGGKTYHFANSGALIR